MSDAPKGSRLALVMADRNRLRDRLAEIERQEMQAVIVSVEPAAMGWNVGLGPDGDTWITVPDEMGQPEAGQIVRFLPPTVTGIHAPDE